VPIQEDATVCPIVRTIVTQAQRYLDPAGTPQVGYWVELDLVRDLTSESPRSLMAYCVWDNGQQVQSLGAAKYGEVW
jgi:hypothetical protein